MSINEKWSDIAYLVQITLSAVCAGALLALGLWEGQWFYRALAVAFAALGVASWATHRSTLVVRTMREDSHKVLDAAEAAVEDARVKLLDAQSKLCAAKAEHDAVSLVRAHIETTLAAHRDRMEGKRT